jgi:hypothetical protein
MTYGVARAFQVIVNTQQPSSEKAGVGGSTPSLATIFCKHLAHRPTRFWLQLAPQFLVDDLAQN